MLYTLLCSPPCYALHLAMLSTLLCSPPCYALHLDMLSTVLCSPPWYALHLAMLSILLSPRSNSPLTIGMACLLVFLHLGTKAHLPRKRFILCMLPSSYLHCFRTYMLALRVLRYWRKVRFTAYLSTYVPGTYKCGAVLCSEQLLHQHRQH